jgi:hypothetical protein
MKGYKTAVMLCDFRARDGIELPAFVGRLYFSSKEKALEMCPWLGKEDPPGIFETYDFPSIMCTCTVEEGFEDWDYVPENY